jgi:hypothetical protein
MFEEAERNRNEDKEITKNFLYNNISLHLAG